MESDNLDSFLGMPQKLVNSLHEFAGDPETVQFLELSYSLALLFLMCMGGAIIYFKSALPYYRSIKHQDWREGKNTLIIFFFGVLLINTPWILEGLINFAYRISEL